MRQAHWHFPTTQRSSNGYSFSIRLLRARHDVPGDSSLDSRVPCGAFLTPDRSLKVSLALEMKPPFPSLVEGVGQGWLCPLDASVPSATRCPFLSLHTQTCSTYLRSLVPLGWARSVASDVIALLREGPGCGGPSSSARRTPHGCPRAGDTWPGCPSPEPSPRCSRVPGWQPAGGSPTSTVPRGPQRIRQISCLDGSCKRATQRHRLASRVLLRPERTAEAGRQDRSPREVCQTELVSIPAPCQAVITSTLCHPGEGGQYFYPHFMEG